jgi:hypothetical protein
MKGIDVDIQEPGAFWEAFNLLKLDEHWNDPGMGTLMQELKAIMDDPMKGLQYVKDNREYLMEQIQTVLEF